jgi:hypothetical protein
MHVSLFLFISLILFQNGETLILCLSVSALSLQNCTARMDVRLFLFKALKNHQNTGENGTISVYLCSKVSKILREQEDV